MSTWPGLDSAAVDRILAAVKPLIKTDRDELRAALESVRNLHVTGVDARLKPTKRKQLTLRIIATAKRMRSRLKEAPWLAHHRWALNRLILDAEKDLRIRDAEKESFPKPLKRFLGIDPRVPALEKLVGWLRDTFEEHFEQSAHHYTRVYAADEVRGDFIDFADAALRELGITNPDGAPYSRSSIANALTTISKTESE